MRARATILVTAFAATLAAGCGGSKQATPAPRDEAVTVLSATMTAAAAIPPGPAAGAGTAEITLNTNLGKACWKLSATGIDKPVSAHVHKASSGKPGPVVIPLGDRFSATGCVVTPTRALRAVARAPASYYVDIHTAGHLDGAVRGQLQASA